MSDSPKFKLFGTGDTTSVLNLITNMQLIVLSGISPTGTVDIEINVDERGWVVDPTLVGLTPGGFTIPNLSSYPNGLNLNLGINSIKIRGVDISGGRTGESIASINRVIDSEFGTVLLAPTGVSAKRNADSVTLEWVDTQPIQISGFNIYASTGPSGSGSGYLRVNSEIISAVNPDSIVEDLQDIESRSYDLTDNTGGTLKVTSEITDPASNVIISSKTLNYYDLLRKPKFRFTQTVSGVIELRKYSFTHNRNSGTANNIVNNDTFSAIPSNKPLYYVITNVYYDPSFGTLRESVYSQEIAVNPLPIDNTIRGLPIRDTSQIIQDYILQVTAVAPELSLIPGSTIREVHIEPFANEIEKSYFLMDFIHRSNSFVALLNIDDPGLTGTSIEVVNSVYKTNLKTALSSNSDSAVQTLIDSAFDNLALNIGVRRPGPTFATVNQIFYLNSRPTRDFIVSQGAIVRSSVNPTAPRFIAKSQAILYAANSDSFFNRITRRYEITVPMVCEIPGTLGNVSANVLDTVDTGALEFRTINIENAVGGQNRASNLALSELCTRAYSSVDTGTVNGYKSAAISVPGVQDALVVPSGSPLMMRDIDPDSGNHVGGKVDLYIKGTAERTISESFAFSYSIGRNVRFQVLDPNLLVFRAIDSRLTPLNPIESIIDNPAEGMGLKNMSLTPVEYYNVSELVFIDYRTIRLNNRVNQPSTLADDIVEGDFKFKMNEQLVMSVQPTLRVLSVVGQSSGALDPQNGYKYNKLQDPYLLGSSTEASDSIEIVPYNGIPTGESIFINNETHILTSLLVEPLNNLGIDILSVRVYSEDRVIQYAGPESRTPDYYFEQGTSTTPLKLYRSNNSTIPNGSVVSVDYSHSENFVVTYVTNSVLQSVQSKIESIRHATADVAIKQSYINPVSISATVVLKPGASVATTDQKIRSALGTLLLNKKVGNTLYISDVTAAIQYVDGVSYVVQPYDRFTLKAGSTRLRDFVSQDAVYIPSLSSGFNKVFLLTDELNYNAYEGGGPSNMFHAVQLNQLSVKSVDSISEIGNSSPASYIIGVNGAYIQGYSDDDTVRKNYPYAEDINATRKEITKNRVLLSLPINENVSNDPSLYEISATYITVDDTSVRDITAGSVQYLTLGDLIIAYK